jgi:uncharacterized protein (DUF2141 family)
MGSISVSGIASAALILALALSPMNAARASEGDGVALDIAVTGIRNAKGRVLACLTQNAKAFPACEKDPNARRVTLSATDGKAIRFTGLKPGTYALALIHDENGNNKVDVALFLPKEGVGVSRNPMLMGPPSFKSAAFVVGTADMKMTVKMKYFL